MAANAMGMGFIFTAKNLGRSTFKGVQKDLTQTAKTSEIASARIDRSMRKIKGGALLAGAGAVGLFAAFKLAGAAGEFERGIAGVGAITRATAKDLKLLENAAIQAGIKTQFSPTEAVEGLTSLGQAGLSAADSITALQPTLDLAAGSLGQLGVADAAGLSVQAMKAFGIQAKDVGFALDRMLRTTNSFNIAAGELPLAFGIGARGALALNASLDDVAISLGLAKNIMPSVERASTSIAVSMERLARKTGQMKLQTEFGVTAIDKATGKFRPYLDIIIDMIDKSKKMTEGQRSNALAMIFGARAGGGVQAILKQLTDGIKTNTGELLKGRAAVEHYRKEMQGAAGAAGEFSSALLNTFAGQKILLTGTLQTLAIVMGKPFARVLKPFVKVVTDTLNVVIKIIEAFPDPAKNAIAAIIAIGSALLLTAGIASLVAGAFGLMGVTWAEFMTLVSGSLLAIAPFALAVFGIIVVLKLFSMAWESNLGGIRDFGLKVFSKLKLMWNGLIQLFTQGGFSGAVRKELNEAGNIGFKNFVIGVFLWVSQIKAFFRGLGEGLEGLGKVFEPAFTIIVDIMTQLGKALGFAFGGPNNPTVAAAKFDMLRAIGVAVGTVLKFLVELFMGPIVTGLHIVSGAIDFAVERFESFKTAIGFVKDAAVGWVDIIQAKFAELSLFLRTAFVAGIVKAAALVAKHAGTISTFANRAISATRGLLSVVGVGEPTEATAEGGGGGSPAARAARALGPGAAAAETHSVTARFQAAQEAGWSDEQMDKLARIITSQQQSIVVEMDGEQVGEITSRATRRATARSFSEVPTGG